MGMPRELKTMHAVLAITAFASFRQAADCAMAACVFGGGAARVPNPKRTPDESLVEPPSATHELDVLFQDCTRNESVVRSTKSRSRENRAAALILVRPIALCMLRASPSR